MENNTQKRGSFVFYRSFSDSINKLPPEMQLPLYKAITMYALDQIEPSFEDDANKCFLEAIWAGIKPQLYANYIRFLNGCKGRSFGELGGAPKGNQNARRKNKQPQNNPKTTPNVNDNVNDNVNVVVSKENNLQNNHENNLHDSSSFLPPSIEEVKAYCQTMQYAIDTEKFFCYYEAKSWMLGDNKMSDWKKALDVWNINEKKYSQPQPSQPKKKVITNEDIFKEMYGEAR